MVGVAKQSMLHFGFAGRLSTGGNLAFPFTPAEMERGPVYRYNLNHVVVPDSPTEMFRTEMMEV